MMQTKEKPRLADDAIEWINRGKWPDRLADEYVQNVSGMTRQEAMRTIQYAIRHGAGRHHKIYDPEVFLTGNIDLFYSHTLCWRDPGFLLDTSHNPDSMADRVCT